MAAEAPPPAEVVPPAPAGEQQQQTEQREKDVKRFITPARSHILIASATNDLRMLHPDSTITDAEEAELLAGLEDKELGIDPGPLAGLTKESRRERYKEDTRGFEDQRTDWVENTQKWIKWALANRPGFKESMMSLGFKEEHMENAAEIFFTEFLDNVEDIPEGELTEEQSRRSTETGLVLFASAMINGCIPEGSHSVDMDLLTTKMQTMEPMLRAFGTHLGANERVQDYIIAAALQSQANLKPIADELRGNLPVEDAATQASLTALARHAGVNEARTEPAAPPEPDVPPAPEFPGTALEIGDVEEKIKENNRFEGATTQEVARLPIENGEYNFTVDMGSITHADADAIVIPSNGKFGLAEGRVENALADDIDQIAKTTTRGDPNAASAKFFRQTSEYAREHSTDIPKRGGEGTIKLVPFGEAVAFPNDQMATRHIDHIIMVNSLPYAEGEKLDAGKIREIVINALVAAAEKGATSVAFPNLAAGNYSEGDFSSPHQAWAPILSGFLAYIEKAQRGEVPGTVKKLSLVEHASAVDENAKIAGEELKAALESIPRIPKQSAAGAPPAAPELQPPVDVAPITDGDRFHFGEDKNIIIVGREPGEGGSYLYTVEGEDAGEPQKISEADLRTYARVLESPDDLESTVTVEGAPAEFTRDNLNAVFADPDYSSDKLIKFLKGRYKEQYEADSGVWEGYSLEQHTKMMMDLYERYFADQDFPSPMDKNLFRLTLALHDIGKPQAASEGDRGNQHVITREIMDKALEDLGYGDEERKLAIAVVDNDFLGAIVDNKADFTETVNAIKQKAGEVNMDPQQFFDLVRVYYAVDSGSYTVGAGGIESLDENFRFDSTAGNLTFIPEIEAVFTRMRTGLVDDSVSKENVDICPPLTPKELEFGLEHLGDVFSLDDEAAQRSGFENSSMARHYVRELQDIFREYNEDRVMSSAELQVNRMEVALEGLGIPSENTEVASTSWYLWDAAKQRYLATRPLMQARLQNADYTYEPVDPLSQREDERERSEQMEHEMFYTMLGRTVYNSYKAGQFSPGSIAGTGERQLSGDALGRLQELLSEEPVQGRGPLPTYKLREIGRIIDENVTHIPPEEDFPIREEFLDGDEA